MASICKTPSDERTVPGVEMTTWAAGPFAETGRDANKDASNRLQRVTAESRLCISSPNPAIQTNRFVPILCNTTFHRRLEPIQFHHRQHDSLPSSLYPLPLHLEQVLIRPLQVQALLVQVQVLLAQVWPCWPRCRPRWSTSCFWLILFFIIVIVIIPIVISGWTNRHQEQGKNNNDNQSSEYATDVIQGSSCSKESWNVP